MASNGADRTYVDKAALGWAERPLRGLRITCVTWRQVGRPGAVQAWLGQCVCGRGRRLRTGSDSYTVLQVTMITGKASRVSGGNEVQTTC